MIIQRMQISVCICIANEETAVLSTLIIMLVLHRDERNMKSNNDIIYDFNISR